MEKTRVEVEILSKKSAIQALAGELRDNPVFKTLPKFWNDWDKNPNSPDDGDPWQTQVNWNAWEKESWHKWDESHHHK